MREVQGSAPRPAETVAASAMANTASHVVATGHVRRPHPPARLLKSHVQM